MKIELTEFLGLGVRRAVVDLDGGVSERRGTYLDSGATTLMSADVHRALTRYLETSCANSHTHAHRAGRATTAAIEAARDAVGELVGFDPSTDSVLFTGNGATGALNYLARALFPPELRLAIKASPATSAAKALFGARSSERLEKLLARPLVVTTVMEHHSNLLPWVEAVGRQHCRFVECTPEGLLDMEDLRRVLREEGERTRVVAVAGVSNVTGVRNPVHEVAALAHAVGAEVAVDAAQMAAHARIALHPPASQERLDYVALSGHKMYAPGSRGALAGALDRTIGAHCVGDVGGGMVDSVSVDDYVPKHDLTAREEAGTPNIPGTLALGLAARGLLSVGLDAVERHEAELTEYALDRLGAIGSVTLYGPSWSRHRRAGVVTFNVGDLPHGLVAAFLDDSHAIAVRNECFCAHPYVKRLLGVTDSDEQAYLADLARGERRTVPGMVRASFGSYTRRDDVDALAAALEELAARSARIRDLYRALPSGDWVRRDAPKALEAESVFEPSGAP